MTPERKKRLNDVLDHRQHDLTVVLENVFDPHNISAVMRTCDAVGIQDVYVLNTRIPRHEKWGRRSSSSAAKWMSVHQFDNTEKCFAALRRNYQKIFTTHLSSDAADLYSLDFTGSVALVFGNEHGGVTEESRLLADGNFIIPQVGIIQSLNISVACAVSVYEAMRQKRNAGHYNVPHLTPERRQEIIGGWNLEESDLQ